MFFCPYYLKNVILFLDEPSGIAESYVFNLVLCLYHEIQISYNIFGFKSKFLNLLLGIACKILLQNPIKNRLIFLWCQRTRIESINQINIHLIR